jgi:Phage gp6-like head-tail connector protein
MLDTLSNVKARLGITTSAYDTFLTEQITMVSDTIEAYCRRVFLEDDYIQTFYRGDMSPGSVLELFHYPVSAVASVMEDGVELDTDYYRLHKGTGRLIRTQGWFLLAEETIVTYTAGLVAVPTPVISVLDSVVQERYNKKTSGVDLNFGSDVQRVSIPGAISIDFDYSLSNNDRKSAFGVILGNNLNVLDFYRSERAVVGDGTLTYVEEAP